MIKIPIIEVEDSSKLPPYAAEGSCARESTLGQCYVFSSGRWMCLNPEFNLVLKKRSVDWKLVLTATATFAVSFAVVLTALLKSVIS